MVDFRRPSHICNPKFYLRASQVVKVAPVNMSSTMIKGMYQFMGQHVIHTALGVDHVLTQHNLQ